MSDKDLQPIVVLGEVLCDLLPPAPGVAIEETTTLTPSLGGAPATVAVQLARLGVPTAMISAVGPDPLSARMLSINHGPHSQGVYYSPLRLTIVSC